MTITIPIWNQEGSGPNEVERNSVISGSMKHTQLKSTRLNHKVRELPPIEKPTVKLHRHKLKQQSTNNIIVISVYGFVNIMTTHSDIVEITHFSSTLDADLHVCAHDKEELIRYTHTHTHRHIHNIDWTKFNQNDKERWREHTQHWCGN